MEPQIPKRRPRLTKPEKEAALAALELVFAGESPWENDPKLYAAARRARDKLYDLL